MNIEIEIKNTGMFALATVSINGVEMLTLPFTSIEDAEKWAESCKPDIERLAKDCDCPKCRAEKEAEAAKSEEASPTWTPEVGMLVKHPREGICEIDFVHENGVCVNLRHIPYRNERVLSHMDTSTPIAELEGLEKGDDVYGVSLEGEIEPFRIESTVLSMYGVKYGDTWFRVNMDGKPKMFGNGKQMFWRTRDRAERFGK